MRLTAFDGQTVNGDADALIVRFGYGQESGIGIQTTLRDRTGAVPVFDHYSYQARSQRFEVHANQHSTISTDDLADLIRSVFRPGGPRTLEGLREPDQPDTAVSLQASVTSLKRVHDRQWEGQFEFADPFWRAASVAYVDGDIVGGDQAAAPVLTITGGSSVTRNRVTLTDNTGRGIAGQPLLIPVSGASRVFIEGHEAAFKSGGGGTWIRADIRADQPTFVDIYVGGTVSPLAETLDLGPLDPDASSNTHWSFPKIYPQDAIQACGAWTPMNTQPPAKTSHGIIAADGDTVTFQLDGDISGIYHTNYNHDHALPSDANGQISLFEAAMTNYDLGSQIRPSAGRETDWDEITAKWDGSDNVADSIVLTSAVAIKSIAGISTPWFTQIVYNNVSTRTWAFTDISGDTQYLTLAQIGGVIAPRFWHAIRAAGQERWENLSATYLNADEAPPTYPDDVPIIAIALGIGLGAPVSDKPSSGLVQDYDPPHTPQPNGGAGVHSGQVQWQVGGCSVELDSEEVPTIDVASVSARQISGSIVNSANGTGITFNGFLCDAVDLVIDCDNLTIRPQSGPIYGGVQFKQPNVWLRLEPGDANTLVNALTADIAYQSRWGL